MKSLLWTLLLLCLGVPVPAQGDCQRDCTSCGLLLPTHQAFNTLVCLLECEAQMSPSLTWDLCHATLWSKQPGSRRAQEEAATSITAKRESGDVGDYGEPGSFEVADEMELRHEDGQPLEQQQPVSMESRASEWFRSALEAEQVREARLEEEEDDDQDRDPEGNWESPQQQGNVGDPDLQAAGIRLAKRFGGFLKGRHSYRKLASRALPASEIEASVTGSHPLQKRYGGFIGIRKSARKWNSQKRVSQLLRQYLSLSGRAGRFNNLSAPNQRRPIDL